MGIGDIMGDFDRVYREINERYERERDRINREYEGAKMLAELEHKKRQRRFHRQMNWILGAWIVLQVVVCALSIINNLHK